MSLFTSETEYSGSPWGPLQEPILGGIDNIQGLLDRGPFGGPYTAPIDPNQTAGIGAGLAAAGGAADVAGAYGSAGQNLAPGLGQAFSYFGNSLDGSQNPWLNNQQQYMDFASSIADSPYMDSQITAALRDPYRGLTEQQLPGNALGAAQMGVSGGSGKQIADAVAQRGYADRASDVGAGMRGNAYQTGLNFANQAANQDYSAAQQSAMQLSGLGTQGLGFMGTGYGYGQQGARDTFDWGTQGQNLQNQQIAGQKEEYYAPWELAQNFGNYVNPLTTNLYTRTSEQDQLMPWLFGSSGPLADIGGDLGDWVGGNIGDWWDSASGLFGGGESGFEGIV